MTARPRFFLSGVGELRDGDEVPVEIEGPGDIRSQSKAEGK